VGWIVLAIPTLSLGETVSPEASMTKEDAVRKDFEALTGTWTVVAAVRDGKKLSEAEIQGIAFTIERTGRAVVKRNEQVIFEGIISIDPTRNPKTEDVTQTSEGENKGKTVLSIYEINGDTLKICSAAGPGKERPVEFSSKPGSGYFLREFRRTSTAAETTIEQMPTKERDS
jgi:uncharacterized protein (TIGR03067 family)